MNILGALTQEEKQRYEKYQGEARRVGEPPGMAEFRDSNKGAMCSPTDLLLNAEQPGAYAEKLDAIFSSKPK